MKTDSSNWTKGASAMCLKISLYVPSSRSFRALRAFHTAFGEMSKPYSALK